MSHFSANELVDAAEGTLAPARRRHLDACPACRRDLDAIIATLAEAGGQPVPEPSPLFWAHFAARVREAVAAERTAARRSWWSGGIRWPAVAPLGALAAIVLAIVASVPSGAARPPVQGGTAEVGDSGLSEPGSPTTEAEWRALAEVVGPLDWDTAGEAGLVFPGVADAAMLDLGAEERRELSRLLATEEAREKS